MSVGQEEEGERLEARLLSHVHSSLDQDNTQITTHTNLSPPLSLSLSNILGDVGVLSDLVVGKDVGVLSGTYDLH